MHSKLGAIAKARLLEEEMVAIWRRTLPVDPNTFIAIGNLGATLVNVGDHQGLALVEEAATSALRELGPAHPCTQERARLLARVRQETDQEPSARAVGALSGLKSKPELNSKKVFVVGFDAAKGRYRARHERAGKPIGVKPANLILDQGSAVIVEGLDVAPEWNGKRGLVESYDAARGHYRLLVKGRTKALDVRVVCCKLHFAAEQEQREHEATHRARATADVRACAVREPEPEPEPELEALSLSRVATD